MHLGLKIIPVSPSILYNYVRLSPFLSLFFCRCRPSAFATVEKSVEVLNRMPYRHLKNLREALKEVEFDEEGVYDIPYNALFSCIPILLSSPYEIIFHDCFFS